MEYPFKDLLPIDEVLEREGYYKDWSHLDPEVFYSLTQISEYIKTKGYGVDVRLLISQLAEHFGLKTTQVVDLANLLQQKFENLEGVTQSFTNNINSLVAQMEADKDAVIANATVDSEVILSRDGETTLQNRLARDFGNMDDFRPDKVSMIEKLMDEFGERAINVKWFGAKGDGITDDVPGIQAAIDFAETTGGTVLLPRIDNNWTFLSKNENDNCIELPSGVRLISEKLPTDRSKQIIKVMVQGVESVINMEGGNNIEIENLYIDTNGFAKKGICSTNYISKFLIKNIRVNNATEIGVDIMGYLGELNNITAFKSPIGTKVHGGENGGTSTQLNRVYSIECGTNIMLDNMTYSQLSTCASDRNIIAYHIVRCKGITISNPGIEDAITTDPDGKLVNYQPFLIENSRYITLTNPSFIVAPSVTGYTVPSLIKLVNVDNFAVESVHVNFLNYDKSLIIEGDTKRVQINDRSFDSGRVTNNSTSSSVYSRRVDYMGSKASSVPGNRWTSPRLGGWTGEIRYSRTGTGIITVYATVTAGTVASGTRVGELNEEYRPPVNWMVELVDASTLTPVGAKLIIKPNGDIVIPPGQTITSGTTYNFGTSFERHV